MNEGPLQTSLSSSTVAVTGCQTENMHFKETPLFDVLVRSPLCPGLHPVISAQFALEMSRSPKSLKNP